MAISLLALGISTLTGAGIYLAKDAWDNRDIKKLKEQWFKILSECNATGVKNHSGQTFLLLDVKRIENGYRCKTKAPSGVDIVALENNKSVLETGLNAKIKINKSWDNEWINIQIINQRPEYEYKPIKCKDNQLFLGYKLDGKPFLLDIDEDPQLGISGQSGTGKSVIKSILITNLLYNYKNNFNLYLCQTVNSDDLIFRNHKSVKMTATTLEESKIMLERILKIAEERNKEFKESNCVSFKQFNKIHPEKRKKRIFLILDEFSFLALEEGDTDKEKELKTYLNSVLKRIAKAGRAMGIHLICVLQRLAVAGNIDSNIRSQLSILSFCQSNSTDSNIAVGTSEAKHLLKREAIFKGQGLYEYLFMPIIKGLKEEEITLQEYLNQFESSVLVPQKINKIKKESPKITDKVDLFEETNRWRVPKSDQQWHLREDTSKIIDISQKSKSDILREDEEVATGSVVDINCQGKYDKAILSFISNYGCITIKQCTQMFYKNRNESQRRLKQLEEKGILKSYLNTRIREKVYYTQKELSSHDILRADFIAKLIEEGATILEYTTPHLLKDLLRPDAILKIKYNNNEYKIILEVDYTHFTNQDKLILYDKYAKEYNEKFILAIMKENSINEKVKLNWYKLKHVQFAMKCQVINLLMS